MQLYNAMSGELEKYTPGEAGATIYVCGITPYDTTHLGHAFTYATFDVLIRFLEFQGYSVSYVQNVTDIDDDILRKANEIGDDWQRLGDRWTAHFIDDNKTLNIRPPDHFPRATDVIPEIIDGVQKMLAAGVAYESAGNVYFHIAHHDQFGKLSKMTLDEMLPVANERGNRPDDPHKKDPLDFVLWQAQAPGEPAWDSPWGPGRPGWHIECSTMATKFLGQTIDVHGGGADLLFPHHECEIAQAECVTGVQPFTRFWMHAAMVRHEGEKMSKSLGNLVMVRDLLQSGVEPDALRLYLANHHYRQAWSYDEGELQEAAGLAQKLHRTVTADSGSGPAPDIEQRLLSFSRHMANDLDTPAALQKLTLLADTILAAADAGQDVSTAQAALRRRASIFGLRLDSADVEPRVAAGWDRHRQRFSG